jgi:glycosyltransferase involved in cell wall biosynthesis
MDLLRRELCSYTDTSSRRPPGSTAATSNRCSLRVLARANGHLKRHGIRVAILSSVHEALDPRIFHKQARTLASAGFNVHLVAQHHRDETRDGVHIHALPALHARWERPLQWVRLARHTHRLRPDVIHIHDPELLPLLLALRRSTGAAAIYDAHEYYGDEIARRTWIPRVLRRSVARLTDVIETYAARRVEAVVAVNEHMAERFRRRGARSIAIHNFPSEEFFNSAAPADVESPVAERLNHTVGYVGLLSPDRGLATVYETAMRLRRAIADASIRVIGRIDWSGLPATVPRDPAAWRAAGVELCGSVPADQIPAALESIDVGWIPFLETANNRRTIPLKLLEYMAAGKPVVASDIGFIATIVGASTCGILAPPGDAAAHADALADLLMNSARARTLGSAGRQAALTRYLWAHEGQRLVDLYQAVIGRRTSQTAGASR